MKKIVSMLLGICIMFTLFQGIGETALAYTEKEPAADQNGIYQIGTSDELYWFAQRVNAGNGTYSAELTADIDITNSGDWTPIGTGSSQFKGSFDGKDHTVRGVTTVLTSYAGFFGNVAGGTIKNLKLENVNITGETKLGGLAGMVSSGGVSNVTVSGTVTGSGRDVGGLIGYLINSTVEYCVNNADVSGSSEVGGLTGHYYDYNYIRFCGNNGSITGYDDNSGSVGAYGYGEGGLIGYLDCRGNTVQYGEVNNCFNTGTVSGICKYIGGLIGSVYYNSEYIVNCYNSGNVESTRTSAAVAGGIVGYSCAGNSPYYLFCYNSGPVSASGTSAQTGGFGGYISSLAMTGYVYWREGSASSAVGDSPVIPSATSLYPVRLESFSKDGDLAGTLSGKIWSNKYTSSFVEDKNNINGGFPVLAWQVCGSSHSFTDTVIPPTCTEGGYTTHTCSMCGYVYTDSFTDPLGHSYDEGVVLKAPTCHSLGTILYTCTRCGSTKTESIPMTEHIYDAGVVTPPTCTEQGYTTYTCTAEGCGYSYKTDYTPAKGHNYVVTVTPATCTEPGLKTYTCTECEEGTEGHSYTEVVPATGHEFKDGVCVRCGKSVEGLCYYIRFSISPDTAAAVVTAPDGSELTPDSDGYYMLSRGFTYAYTLSCEHCADLTGTISGIDETWTDDGKEYYTMSATLAADTNRVDFSGSNCTVSIDGKETEYVDVDYGKTLSFKVQPTDNYWINSILAVVESPAVCTDVWDGTTATEFASGSGTESDPYIIKTGAQLAYMAAQINSSVSFNGQYIKLDADIDMNKVEWAGVEYYKSGTYDMQYFSGIFDGGGHVIRNLRHSSTSVDTPAGGLFNALSGATIKNLDIAECDINVAYQGAALASLAANGSTIENCWVTGSVNVQYYRAAGLVDVVSNSQVTDCWSAASVSGTVGTKMYIGGIAGYVYGASGGTGSGGVISGCRNLGDISSSGSNACVGGVVGVLYYNGTMKNCSNSGKVSFTGAFSSSNETQNTLAYTFGVGGVAGMMQGFSMYPAIMDGCFNSGEITASAGRVGGVVGNLSDRMSPTAVTSVTDCYNSGGVTMISSTGYSGGIAGRVYGTGSSYGDYLTVKKCYNAGKVEGGASGAAVGLGAYAEIEDCYSLENMAQAILSYNYSNTVSLETGTFKTESEMQSGSFIVSLDTDSFTDDIYYKNNGYPILKWESDVPEVCGEYETLDVEYDDKNETYTIENITKPVKVYISTRTSVTEKNITFDVQPAEVIGDNLGIDVADESGTKIAPIDDNGKIFKLNVGSTYYYTVTAKGFETVSGSIDVSESSGYLISIRMTESVPTNTVNFELDKNCAAVYSSADDKDISGGITVNSGDSLKFYVVPDDGYEVASINISGSSDKRDVWDGTSSDTSWYDSSLMEYTISTGSQLEGLAELIDGGVTFAGKVVYLDGDIDMTAGNMSPIGEKKYSSDPGAPFSGIFNGQGHTITVEINRNNYSGLFGYANGATIKNILLSGSVQGYYSFGGILAYGVDTTLESCFNTAAVTSLSLCGAGGVAGSISGNSKLIECYNSGNISGGLGVAGIACSVVAGDGMEAEITGCRNDGTITATYVAHGTGAAGIAADINSNVYVDLCSNGGVINSAGSWVGGLFATAGSSVVITNCYNTGAVNCTKPSGDTYSNTNYVGGIIGGAPASLTMKNCYNAGAITFTAGGGGAAGAIVGSMNQGSPTLYQNNYWLTGTCDSAVDNSGGVVIIYTDAQIKEVSAEELSSLYSTLGDISWKQDVTTSNSGYPILRTAPDLSSVSRLRSLGEGEYMFDAVSKDMTVYISLAEPVESVTLGGSELKLQKGEIGKLMVSILPESASGRSVNWLSADESVASVDESGNVTAVKAGTTEIFAYVGSIYATCKVTVTEPSYSVIFSGGSGSEGTAPTVENQIQGSSFKIPENTFTKEGRKFLYWNDGTDNYYPGDTYEMPEGNVTFTAQWKNAGGNISVTSKSDSFNIIYVSGENGGMTDGDTLKFEVNSANTEIKPVVFDSSDSSEPIYIEADSSGTYTISGISGDVKIDVYILGDVNQDGYANALDALMILKGSADLTDPIVKYCADVSGDGYVNALDALMILRMSRC